MSTQEDPPEDATRPFVSVVVPVYNDPAGLETTLDSLVDQTYPDDRHEVIAVDNGSTDRTGEVASRYADANATVRTIREPAGGSYTARNAGIRAAEGSILSFIDADMWVDPDWLESVVDCLSETGAAYLACDVELADTGGRAGLAERYNRRTAFPIRKYVEEWKFAPTCCLTVRRAVVEDVGDFDSRMVSGGDREFGNRVADAGYDLAFAEDVTVTHPPRTELTSILKKSVRVGRGAYQLRYHYPDRYGHPAAALANPFAYTPPLPRTMAQTVRGWGELSRGQQLLFGALAWLLTLGQAYGKLDELIERSDLSLRSGRPADGASE